MKQQALDSNPNLPGRPRNAALDGVLLKTALELFLEHGIEGASFEQIAKRTGVTRATIYRRWSSREDLLAAALQSIRDAEARNPDRLANMTIDELLRYLADMFTDYLVKPESRRLLARLIGSLPAHPSLMAIYRERFAEPVWRAIFAALERARASGALPDAPPNDILRSLLLGAVYYRSVMRADTPNREQERVWVEDVMRRLGLPLKEVEAPARQTTNVPPWTEQGKAPD